MNDVIYLDYAAATPVDPQVLRAMQPYYTEYFYNPSATYLAAKHVRTVLDDARGSVAHWLGCRQSEVVFTAGGTEANNLAVHGILRQYPSANVVVSAVEHESILAPAQQYERRLVPVDSSGRVQLEKLQAVIDDNTALVSIMYANNEVGTIQPVREVAKIIAALRLDRRRSGNTMPLYLHSDACQAANYLDLHVNRLMVDMLTLNGGKVYGPKQSGVLYVKAGTRLSPLVSGGGQEQSLRSGTENVAQAVGFAAALAQAQAQREIESRRVLHLRQLCEQLITERLTGAVINGSKTHRLVNSIHVTFPGVDNERLLIQLDTAGILAAAGSACSASSAAASHVLLAMGISDTAAQSSVRFTLGRGTTESAVRTTVDTLHKLVTS